MTLMILLLVGVVAGWAIGLVLRRVGAISRLFDMILGTVGAFVAGAMATSALLAGLTPLDIGVAAAGAATLVCLAHVVSAVVRPVHAKYYRR